jgi:dihydroorotate dehydrogenase (fumarate)
MPALDTTYLGLRLRSPIVASAGPLTGDADTAARLADAGAGALVLPSLFEEEIVHEEVQFASAWEAGAEHYAEALDYFPSVEPFQTPLDRYLANLERVKARVGIPVIASLNAFSPGGWERYAGLLGSAGADALELNVYRVAADPARSAADVEDDDVAIVAAVTRAVDLPVAVKLSPFYSAMANFAVRAVEAGARGLVLFNRFYQPDLDIETLELVPRLELSSPWELRLPVRWIAILHPLLVGRASLAATSGIESGADVARALLVGADVAMTTSAVLRHGAEHIALIENQLRAWMDEHEYVSVDQLRGSVSSATAESPAAFERANYVRVLHSWTSPVSTARDEQAYSPEGVSLSPGARSLPSSRELLP